MKIRIRDELHGSYLWELRNNFWVRILKFFDVDADPGVFLTIDLGPGMEKNWFGIHVQHSVLSGSIASIPGKSFLRPCHPGPQATNFLHLNSRQNMWLSVLFGDTPRDALPSENSTPTRHAPIKKIGTTTEGHFFLQSSSVCQSCFRFCSYRTAF